MVKEAEKEGKKEQKVAYGRIRSCGSKGCAKANSLHPAAVEGAHRARHRFARLQPFFGRKNAGEVRRKKENTSLAISHFLLYIQTR